MASSSQVALGGSASLAVRRLDEENDVEAGVVKETSEAALVADGNDREEQELADVVEEEVPKVAPLVEAGVVEDSPKVADVNVPRKIAEEFTWAFVLKLYCIFAGLFFVSTCIATIFLKHPRILKFFQQHTVVSWGAYISVLLTIPVGKKSAAPTRKHSTLFFRRKGPRPGPDSILANETFRGWSTTGKEINNPNQHTVARFNF
jgi:hypothetical protein